jgi:peptide-methionine (S)-S-oxide reductase
MTMTQARVAFAAGCFWGVEEAFRHIPGVKETAVGYIGGSSEDPTYQEVCSGTTGHTEAVEVVYDPDEVTFERLLELFWENHDPTQLNRQGPDHGSQYRSGIFFHSPEQEAAAQASKEGAAPRFPLPIVTEISPASTFWRAEEYHQRYFEKNGMVGCKTPQ